MICQSPTSRAVWLDYSEIRMKKKPLAGPIIAREILTLANEAVAPRRAKNPKPSIVCGSVSAPQVSAQGSDDENLCWVCRRLKISAWRETTDQLSAQE
jgi:hypothetical protein